MRALHGSPFCGSWFPSDSGELRELLARKFEESQRRTGPSLYEGALAFVVPHAGIRYSGTVAASAYRHLSQSGARRVILLGFSHRRAVNGIGIPDLEGYQTPLGEVVLDRGTADELARQRPFRIMSETTLCDHSVEIQLPLLKQAVPDAALVPLYVGQLSEEERREAARILAGLLEAGTVVLASSDFTHYGRDFHYLPFPADDQVAWRLEGLDRGLIDASGSLDPEVFRGELDQTRSTVCGREPIGLLLETLRRRAGPEVFQETLDYQTSGEITGDYAMSVSYASLGYFPADSFRVGEEDQRILLESARRTLRRLEETGARIIVPPEAGGEALSRRMAAFVTLREKGDLRGCVGRRQSDDPLSVSIPELTLSAALDDTRFEPGPVCEADTDIEISILSPMKRITAPEQLEAGKHGGVVENGAHKGLLLPQVARERNWSRKEFLEALAMKAGTKPNIYEHPETRLWVFRAQSFGSGVR